MQKAHRQGQEQQPQEQQRRGGIGLSFSGGGFRATAFSLGTLTLLQDIDLLAQAKVMSSVSGGSLALGTYLCAKAGSGAKKESDFEFIDCFYKPLMTFLGEERLVSAFVDAKQLLKGEKLIRSAAEATDQFFNERLKSRTRPIKTQATLGDPMITDMLANEQLSPDYIFFNATNITSLDLFRFGIKRGDHKNDSAEEQLPVFVLNRYFLKHNRDSAEGKLIYEQANKLRIADCVAASFCFPAAFEPLLFPDDFFASEEARQHFRGDLICDHKPYLALLDGGLYDNLGLASIEDIRGSLHDSNEGRPPQQQPIHYIIATDVDQIPTQSSSYSDPEADRRLQSVSSKPQQERKGDNALCLIKVLTVAVITLFILDLISSPWLATRSTGGLDWISIIRLVIVSVVIGDIFFLYLLISRGESTGPGDLLNLSKASAKKASLDSWPAILQPLLWQLFTKPSQLWQTVNGRRLSQLMPAFSGFLKRTRSLTYGFLQQGYEAQLSSDCHLIRNMIFELVHGQESDPDYAYKLITLPTKDYRHEEKLNPISPIARKVTRARYVSMMLEAFSIAKPVDRNDDHLMLRLLRQNDGHLLGEAVTIIDELKLREADQVWRWLCNNLSCFRDDNSCLPADNQILSLPIQDLINKLQKIFEDQIGNNHQLIDRCLVSPEESTASYSWIPLICEMATNVPTTFWLRDFCWYVPNHYDSQRRILQNGKWLVNEPKPEDLPDPTLKPINLGSLAHHLGPAPAAGVCTVAGYVSTCFNLLEFFYTWLGTCSHSQQKLLEILKQSRLPFQEDEFQQLEELPYALRNKVWRLLKQDEKQECLPQHTLDVLHLLEYPLNRRNGLPDAYWAGQAED